MRVVNTTSTQGTDYVKDGVLYVDNLDGGVLVESESDIANLPSDYRPGTLAHTAGWKKIWERDSHGIWVPVVGGD